MQLQFVKIYQDISSSTFFFLLSSTMRFNFTFLLALTAFAAAASVTADDGISPPSSMDVQPVANPASAPAPQPVYNSKPEKKKKNKHHGAKFAKPIANKKPKNKHHGAKFAKPIANKKTKNKHHGVKPIDEKPAGSTDGTSITSPTTN